MTAMIVPRVVEKGSAQKQGPSLTELQGITQTVGQRHCCLLLFVRRSRRLFMYYSGSGYFPYLDWCS